MKNLIILAALGATAAANAAVQFDDFTTGPYSVTLTSGMDTAFQAASVPGLTRTTRLNVESNPLVRDISLSIGGGFSIADNGTMADSWVRIGYGYENNGSGGLVVDPLNMNLSGESSFQIDFLSNDLANDVKIYVGTWNGSSLDLSTATAVAPGGNASTPFSMNLSFASFTGTASFSDVDVVVFEFDNSPSGDFALSQLTAVPEPMSMLALGAGVSAVLARRRKKA